MPIKAGQAVIDITAGTTKFVVDMETAKAKLREFGAAGVSEHRAVAAAMKELEGNFLNNKRAADAFLLTIPGIGNALKAAFPVIGAIAFAGVIVEVTSKVREFYKEMSDAPRLIDASFRSLNNSARTSADELQVANDRLLNDISKLEGKRQNTLAIALDEARLMADKLGESLENDLQKLNKLLTEHQVDSWWKSIASGQSRTDYINQRMQGFALEIQDKVNVGYVQIASAKTPDEAKNAVAQLAAVLTGAFETEIKNAQINLGRARAEAQPHTPVMTDRNNNVIAYGLTVPGRNTTIEQHDLENQINALRAMEARIVAQVQNYDYTAKKESLEVAKENEAPEKPYNARIQEMNTALDAAKAKLDLIGKPLFLQDAVNAFDEASKIIDELNKRLDKNHQLSDAQKQKIHELALETRNYNSETAAQEKLYSATQAIDERIKAQQALTAAIGQGYEATKQANVEMRVMQEIGQHLKDPQWMKDNALYIAVLRTRYGQEYDAQHQQQVTQSVQKLNDQIGLERDLAAVEAQGAEAVRQVTLAHRLAEIARDEDAGSARRLMAAQIELYNLERERAAAGEVEKINEKIQATDRMTAAILRGAAAVRQANLDTRVAEILRDENGPTVDAAERIGAATRQSQGEFDQEAARAVAHTNRVQELQDQIELLQRGLDLLQTQGGTEREKLGVEIAIRDLQNQQLHAIAEQTLSLGGARNAVRAFFEEMQADARRASQDIAKTLYDALHGTVEGIADELAKVMTGQYRRGGFGKMFEGVGESAVRSTLTTAMHVGLGSLADHVGKDTALGKVISGIAGGKADGSEKNPFYVKVVGSARSGYGGPNGDQGPVLTGDEGNQGDQGSAAGGIFSYLFGMFLGPGRAGGGDVDPGTIYPVGERGELEYFAPRVPGTIIPANRLGGGDHFEVHIHAEGAEIGVENRIRQMMSTVQTSSVTSSMRAHVDRARRTPQRS